MSTAVAIALLTSAFAITAPATSISELAPQAKAASLSFASESSLPVGISYGLTAVDSQTLILDQQAHTHVAAGLRTVFYACPNEPQAIGGSRLSFDFEAEQAYELVCRAGQKAEIRPADRC